MQESNPGGKRVADQLCRASFQRSIRRCLLKLTMVALFVAVMAADVPCCDPAHRAYATGESRVAECSGRGGVAVTKPFTDQGGHTFEQLVDCKFMCMPVRVEK